jgi:hypothetical protein
MAIARPAIAIRLHGRGFPVKGTKYELTARACIAAAIGRLISGSASTSVYDYSIRHIIINGNISEDCSALDNDRQCHFSGSGSKGDYDS